MKISSCTTLSNVALAAVALTLTACGGGGGSSGSGPPAAAPPPPAVNTAPTIANLSASQTVAQDASSEPTAFSVNDVESGASAVMVTAESSNPELISAHGVQLSGNDASRSLLLTPMEGVAGTSTVTITATDSAGLSTQQVVDVTVTSEQRSFREMVGTAYAKDDDVEGEQITGYSWVDNPEEDDTAFDHLFTE
ncbi:MAG: Ig-like domain-containing protein [Steroidobacter sp.]